MRLRNRSHHQVAQAVAFLLGLGQYRCTTWSDPQWTYLDVQPNPVGEDYVRFARWAEGTGILLNRVGGSFPLRRFTCVAAGDDKLENVSLMTMVIHLERWGVTEAEVERINALDNGEVYRMRDGAFEVRRVL